MTGTKEETVEIAKTVETAKAVEIAEVGKDSNKSEGEYSNLVRVPCIRYSITFLKKFVPILALLDSGSEINAINPTFAQELGLPIRTTDVGAQKINSTMLDNFGMMVVAFSVMDKANWVRFFEKTFLVANISLKVVLEMPFFTLSGADVDFSGRKLCWKTYTTEKAPQLLGASR